MIDHPLAGQPVKRCRWCGTAMLVWCVTEKGEHMPIEPEPNDDGNVEIAIDERRLGVPLAIVHAGPPGMLDDWVAYMPHHATCEGNHKRATKIIDEAKARARHPTKEAQ